MTPEMASAFRDMMCEGLAGEAQTTRRVIEAVPDDRSDYKPDEKSMNAGDLAWHLASASVWLLDSVANLSFGQPTEPARPATIAEVGAWYAEHYAAANERVRAMTAEQLMTPVDFFGAFNYPAVMYLNFVSKHEVHHRGQLSTYLRPMGSKVPSIYGGSADEPWQAPDASAASN